MGDVYRARDTRLSRDVALKILPESFAAAGDRLQRFETETRAVAALNHPNILAVFDTGKHNGSPYMVSELLEGESLRAALERGPLPPRKTIEYAVQIAQGMASAHEKGIVHRDIKPENIFITRDGRVKILDFGLAKQAEQAASNGVTMTSSHTAAGMVLGTAGYMSPEQVKGELADARSDIFAFGAVLYEMLCGSRAFHRDTTAETMTAILREDPPEFPGNGHPVSPALDRIVRRCLEKDPEQRFQSAKDLSFALSALSGSDSSVASRIAPAPAKVRPWMWAAIVLAALAAAAITWFAMSRPASARRVQFAIPVSGEVSHLALSLDGSMLAFVSPDENTGIPMLFVQRVGSPDVRALAGTEGASYPFWSPDGSNLGFFGNGKLQKVAIAGGAPQALAKVWAARGGSWSKQNVIIYEPDAGMPIWKINADGSGAGPVTDKIFVFKDDQSHRWPMFLPDGNHFLFWAGNFGSTRDASSGGIYESSLDKQERKLVALAHSSFAFDSHHLYYANDEKRLVSVAFDPVKGIAGGDTTVLSNTVALQPSTYWTALTASRNGTLVYNTATGASTSQLSWIDRNGKQLGQIGTPAVQYNPTLSPDGSRVAVDISDQRANNVDIWLESTTGAGNSRFTFDPSEEVVGVWSRDGKVLAYRTAGGAEEGGLFLKATNGLERPKLLFPIQGQDDIFPNSWSLGDKQILATYESATGYSLRLITAAGGASTPFNPGPGNQSNGMISPDGNWVAYASDESGSWEIYVTTFPEAAGKWQISRGGGTEPRWRGDSKELFYLAPGGILTSVSVTTSGTFSSGTPVPLFQFHGRPPISSSDVFSYDVSKDGKRFLVNRYVKPEKIEPLTIVLNAGSQP